MTYPTVADVKGAASRIWPNATAINVGLVSGVPTKTYRVSAINENNRLLGKLDGTTLEDLKLRLERRLKSRIELGAQVLTSPANA